MRLRYSLSFLLLVFVCAHGCSSSQKSGDGSAMETGSAESGADAVGSIPEDMLAQEEQAGETESTETAENTESMETTPEPTSEAENAEADPFADLMTEEPAAGASESLAVTEETTDGGAAMAGGAMETYSVKAGDTLMKIAFNLYGDVDRWKDLHDWNRGTIKKANQLKAGMRLSYEAPLQPFQQEELAHTYTIKQGDTLANIADEVYGRKMKYRKLQNYNKSLIKNPHRIFAGFTIFYDITAKEMAEAEARRKERMAESSIPSSIAPPQEAFPAPSEVKPLAISPPSSAIAPPSLPPAAIAPPAVPAPASTGAQ